MSLRSEISVATGIGASELRFLEATAPARYKSFPIPKRGGGQRIIAQPSREIKLIQRWIVDHVLEDYPVHEAAKAYRRGVGIRSNAEEHATARFIVKLDFHDYFHSVKPGDLLKVARKQEAKLGNADQQTLMRFLFWGRGTSVPLCLSIGAPSSPSVSNIVLFQLDEKISVACSRLGVTYTRYADDITLSASSYEQATKAEERVRKLIESSKSPILTLNERKCGIFGPGQRRMVTGLVVTPQGLISLGRQRKRLIHALIHRMSIGTLEAEKKAHLKGLLAFAIDCEPAFVERLRQKYGNETVDRVLAYWIPPRGPLR